MNDHTDLEQQLRDGLAHRARALDAAPPVGGSLAVQETSRRRTAARHRRRMTVASVGTAAAVAAGLVVIARDPGQKVSTERDRPASGGLAAGAATGSSSGSASGSPSGWTGADRAGADVSDLPSLSLQLPAEYVLSSDSARRIEQGSGLPAADLAVAAHAEPGSPLRFVVASVQSAKRLTPGVGGTETTIAGRPARVISRRAATLITFDVSDTERALVFAAGVDDTELADWLGRLAPDASGRWVFGGAQEAGGLTVVPTVTPTGQSSRYMAWNSVAGLPETCDVSGYALELSSGGAYELWAALAEVTRWSTEMPVVTRASVPGVADGAIGFVNSWGEALVPVDDAVARIGVWHSGSTVVNQELAPLLVRVADGDRPVVDPAAGDAPPACTDGKRVPATTVYDGVDSPPDPATDPATDPAADAPSPTAPPTTSVGS